MAIINIKEMIALCSLSLSLKAITLTPLLNLSFTKYILSNKAIKNTIFLIVKMEHYAKLIP